MTEPDGRMTERLRLSVLDQSPVSEGSTAAQALRHSVQLAQHAERLGYHRHWLAEHHGGPMLAGASPEVLISAIAGATQRIRVGSGGVMLPHYSPLKVAETFSILAGLYPGRIDLGLGRAAGTDAITTHALQRDRRQGLPEDFPQQLAELLAYLGATFPADHPFARLAQLPGRPEQPEPWLLGSSADSATWAAQLGLPYAFADFINPHGASIARRYAETYEGFERAPAAQVAVAVWAIAADSAAEARHLATSSAMALRLLRRGHLIPVPPPETAAAFLRGLGERAERHISRRRRAVLGTGEEVRAGLEAVAGEYGAGEVIVVTITHDHGARLRSYELIAEAFGLDRGAAGTGTRAAVA